ncbi:MAG: hypothetical protein EOO27_16055 [Comamonadaceae bacterium]|nr:MAG: hypothetical protein EOO27_16055 [Comamonadaceae bacterium]
MIINLVLDVIENIETPEAAAAVEYAQRVGIRFKTVSNYKKIMWSLVRALHIRSFSISADGLQAEFPDAPPDIWLEKQAVIDFPEALNLCVTALAREGRRCWVLVDRLDAAFQEDPQLERAALKTLLMAYKDFMGFAQIRLKLFLRTDLFDQVTTDGGFRELTHVQDRTSPPMSWDNDQLQTMIMERFLFNQPIRDKYGVTQADMRSPDLRVAAFFSIFPQQIEVGSRQTDSWTWMLNRITDANGVRTPRDLHSLVTNAARAEARLLSVGGNDDADVLITSTAVKTGLDQLSADKVKTSLVAENPSLEPLIRVFKGGKAEHNAETLEKLLGSGWAESIEDLQRIGFIEKIRGSDSWKIPQLYRPGLEITQGAAFAK